MYLRLDDDTRVLPDGILGGSPTTYLRLTDAGRRVVDAIARGEAVAASALVDRLIDTGAAHRVPDQGVPDNGSRRFDLVDVTVVVPALDAAVDRRGLDGVASIIVVDDGSYPPLPDAMIRHDHPRGPGPSRNDGATRVDTDLILFLDTSVTMAPGALVTMLGHFDDPQVALVAPRVRSRAGVSRLARYERRRSPLDLGPRSARVAPRTRVSYVPSAAVMIRTDVFHALGGFDEQLRYGEDVDLVWRLAARGCRMRYVADAVAEHSPRSSWRALLRQRFSYGSSAAALARRHGELVAPAMLSPWSIAVWALAFVGQPVLSAGVAAGTTVTLHRKLPSLPTSEAVRLTVNGHLGAGRQLLEATRRAWLPIVVVAAVGSRRSRRLLALAAVAAWWPVPSDAGPLDVVGEGAIRCADDAAYCTGVWAGMLRERTLRPLEPVFSRAGGASGSVRDRVASVWSRFRQRTR